MAGGAPDLRQQAVDELYALDPDQFIDRRNQLATAAREHGRPDVAKQISGLRKPSRSAWTVNALARAEPDLLDELVDVADRLREAEQNLDGDQLRELSRRRRTLLDALARAAFAATDQRAPSAAVQEEVRATLSAAIADPQVGDLVRTGTVLRAAKWDGFGTFVRPDLALVPPPGDRPAKKRADASTVAKASDRAPTAASAERDRARQAAEKEQRRAQIAAAAAAVADAKEELTAAEHGEREQVDLVRGLTKELAEAKRERDAAARAVRDAHRRLANAQQSLERARGRQLSRR